MISRFFIDRPVFAAVISIVIVIAGLVAYRSLPFSAYPEISPPTVRVTAIYPGANAQVVADTVAQAIEEQVNGVEGMTYMYGTCANNGEYRLTILFETGTDPDMAAVRVQNRVSMALPTLPQEVQAQGVTTKKESVNMIMVISLSSPDRRYDDLFLSNYAALRITDELTRLSGVGSIMSLGADKYSMRIWLDPDRLKARDLTTTDVIAAVREQNVQVAAGQIGQSPAPKGLKFQYIVNVKGRLDDPAEFEDIVLKSGSDGRLTRIKDVGRVEIGSKSYFVSSTYSGQPSCTLLVYQLPGANSIEVGDRLTGKMKELSADFPEGIEYNIAYDATKFIRASISEVKETLFIAVVVVFIVILVFLQDWRATLIPAMAIPVSIIGTFAVMSALRFSVNTLTLFGLVLAIGIVVDNAIVVVENTVRNMEEHGLERREATIRAMEEVSNPIVAITLVLMAVFIPVAFLGGVTGELYRQFALTIAASTAISGINALTLSPALCALFLRKPRERRNWFARAFNWTFSKTTGGYQGIVESTVRRRGLVLLLYFIIAGLGYWGVVRLPTGFVPNEDKGVLFINAQLPDAASKERTDEVIKAIDRLLANTPGIDRWTLFSGFSILDFAASSNCVFGAVDLVPWAKRTDSSLSASALAGRLWKEMQNIQEANVFIFESPVIEGVGFSGGFEMALEDRGGIGHAALQEMASQMVAAAGARPELQRLFTTYRASVPQKLVEVDRGKVKTLGIPLSSVFETLQGYIGELYLNDFNKFGRTYQVRFQGEAESRSRIKDIERLEVRSATGGMVPLGTLVEVRDAVGPQTIRRHNMYPAAMINGVAAPGHSSGEAIETMESLARNTLPNTMGIDWSGMSFQEKKASGGGAFILTLSVVFVYLVLCALYESWSLPLAVVLVVPLALLGTVIAVTMRGMDINVYTQIGLVVLIALASKNSILIVEFARDLNTRGKGIIEAAVEAARIRFRPVVMTSLAFITGVFPLVIATGASDGSRRALGTAVFGGMISGTFLTVIFVPVFCVVIWKVSAWFRTRAVARGGDKRGTMHPEGA